MPVRNRRNIETEKYVARRQAANMGGIDAEDLLKLIDAKGGDYYRGDLIPSPEGKAAYDNIGMTQSNSPMFALQQDILQEMRGYYGLNGRTNATAVPTLSPTEKAALTTLDPRETKMIRPALEDPGGPTENWNLAPSYRGMTNTGPAYPKKLQNINREYVPSPVASVSRAAAPTEIKEPFPIQTTVPTEPAVKVDAPYVTTTVPKQKSPAAEEIKDSYLNKILGYNVKDIYEQIKNTKGLLTNSALTDVAIAGGGVLGLTGIAGLGGADGGDATAMALLGAGTAAAPAIHNAVRNPAYRVPMKNGRGLVAAIAAGSGAGAGTSMLMDALGLTNQG